MSWNRGQVVALLKVYQLHPYLYNVYKAVYFTYEERQEKLHDICEQLRAHKSDITVEQIQEKIGRLRKQYLQQRRLVKEAQAKGAEYKPQLWCFNRLRFFDEIYNDLDDHNEVIEILDTDDQANSTGSGTASQSSVNKLKKLKRTINGDINENNIGSLKNAECDNLCKFNKRTRCQEEAQTKKDHSNHTHHEESNMICDNNDPSCARNDVICDEDARSADGSRVIDQNYRTNDPDCDESDLSFNNESIIHDGVSYDGDEEDETRRSDCMSMPDSGEYVLSPPVKKELPGVPNGQLLEQLGVNKEDNTHDDEHYSSLVAECKATVDGLRRRFLDEACANLSIHDKGEMYFKEYFVLGELACIGNDQAEELYTPGTWLDIKYLYENDASPFSKMKDELVPSWDDESQLKYLQPSTSRQKYEKNGLDFPVRKRDNSGNSEEPNSSTDSVEPINLSNFKIDGDLEKDTFVNLNGPFNGRGGIGFEQASVSNGHSSRGLSNAETSSVRDQIMVLPTNEFRGSAASNEGQNQQVMQQPGSNDAPRESHQNRIFPAENQQVILQPYNNCPHNDHVHHAGVADIPQPLNMNRNAAANGDHQPNINGNQNPANQRPAYNRQPIFIRYLNRLAGVRAQNENEAYDGRDDAFEERNRDQYWSDEDSSDGYDSVSADSGQGDDFYSGGT